jgi:hypothetical protein
MQLAGQEHRKGFYAVLTGFRAYSPRSSALCVSMAITTGTSRSRQPSQAPLTRSRTAVLLLRLRC